MDVWMNVRVCVMTATYSPNFGCFPLAFNRATFIHNNKNQRASNHIKKPHQLMRDIENLRESLTVGRCITVSVLLETFDQTS